MASGSSLWRHALEERAVPVASESTLNRVVQLAARVLDVPIALIVLAVQDRLVSAAAVGANVDELPRDTAPCADVLAAGEPLVKSALAPEERLILGESTPVASYAGVPLVVDDPWWQEEPAMLGTLCVFDTETRTLDAAALDMLADLGAIAAEALKRGRLRSYHDDILESITDAFFALNRDWRFTYVNQQAEAILERSREDLLGKNVWEEFPEAVDLKFYEQYHRAVNTQQSVQFEAYFPPLDKWFRVNAYPFEGGLSVYFDDVTERKEAERNLEHSLEQNRAILQTTSDGYLMYSVEGTIVDVNPAYCEIVGYSRAELMEMTLHDLEAHMPPEELNRRLRRFALEEFATAGTRRFETQHRCKDGSLVDIEVSIGILQTKDSPLVHAFVRDITERKEAQHELQAREEYLSVTLNSIGDAVIATDCDKRVTRMNNVAEALTGYDREEAEGRLLTDVFEIVNAHSRKPVQNPVEEVLQKGHIVGLANHTVLIAKDGTERQIADSAAPIRTEDGDLLGVVLVFRDVTEQYERQEALRQSKIALEQAQALAQTGNAVWDLKRDRFVLSEEAGRLLGLEPGVEHPIIDFLRVVHPDDRASLQNELSGLREGEDHNLEYRVIPAGGDEVRWLRGRGRPTAMEDGEVVRVLGTIADITEQKRQASIERRFGRLLEAASSEIYIFDAKTLQFVQSNRGARENLGYTEDELFGMTPLDLKPFDRESFEELLQPLRTGEEELIVFETTHRRADGTTYPVRVRLQLSRQETPPVFIAIVLDVTEQKQAEEALRQSEERYRTLVEQSHDAIYIYRGQQLLFVNQRTCDLTGYTEEELYNMNVFELVHPDDREHVAEIARKRAEGEATPRYEARLVRSDGSVRYGEFSVRAITYKGEYAAIGSIRDVTERKRAEDALRHRESKVQSLYESVGELMLAQTREEVAARILSLVDDTLQYPISAVRYQEGDRLVPVSVSQRSHELMGGERPAYAIEGESAVAQVFRSGQSAIYGDVTDSAPIANQGDVRSTAYVPIGRDGTISIGSIEPEGIEPFDVQLLEILAHNAASVLDRIEREDALRSARDQAEEMNRLKSAFLANMSHEIRTPLTSIIGFAEVLGEEAEGTGKRFARLIREGGQRLLETLNSVLDLSQLEAGSMKLSPEDIDVAEEVRQVAELYEPRARKEDVDLRIETPDSPLEGRLDTGALQRVISNLLSNAIKFTDPGGRITLQLTGEPEHVLLVVTDTGVGIESDFMPHVFDAFKQESTGSRRTYEGSGLGLAITGRIVDLMGGSIDVKSEKTVGTRFTIRLPRYTD